MDFLWHKVSDKEKEEIKKQAKTILDSFSFKLSKLNYNNKKIEIVREKGQREEGNKTKENFSRRIMFENAPHKKGDFIVAETKKW